MVDPSLVIVDLVLVKSRATPQLAATSYLLHGSAAEPLPRMSLKHNSAFVHKQIPKRWIVYLGTGLGTVPPLQQFEKFKGNRFDKAS